MPEPLTRTQKRQKETKERIFRVAMEMFAKNSFENTTVSDITEAADIGKGTFFTYFPTKEAVFKQLGEITMEMMSATAEEGIKAKQPIPLVLKNTLTASAEWHEANKPITQQMVRLNVSMEPNTPNKKRFLELLTNLIRIGQENGELNNEINVQDAALVLAAIYFTAVSVWALTENVSLRERLESAVDIVLKGLSART
ncbi:MAG: TetR/AcrR family transcriptional regulator [Anaerolineales bacterium]|nr:TetR/AcrR family transcriptional regulator [Anaerolineales bacterium]